MKWLLEKLRQWGKRNHPRLAAVLWAPEPPKPQVWRSRPPARQHLLASAPSWTLAPPYKLRGRKFEEV